MDNFQDFYKMDKICTSIYPDFATHILNFQSLPEDEGLTDTAAVATHPLDSPEEPPHAPHCFLSMALLLLTFTYEAYVSSSHPIPYPSAPFFTSFPAQLPRGASQSCWQQTIQFSTFRSTSHSSGLIQQP